MEKSYVSLEAKVCPVCGKTHSHNAGILIDRKMRNSLEHETITGYGLCEEHDRLFKKGYVALVEVDESRSEITGEGIRPENAYRTGRIIHVRKKLVLDMIPSLRGTKLGPMAYIKPEVFNYLEKLKESAGAESEDKDEQTGNSNSDGKDTGNS